MLLALLPLAVWVLLAIGLLVWMQPRLLLREALLAAAVLCAAWLVLTTELLSLFQGIAFWPVVCAWLVPLAGLVFLLYRKREVVGDLQIALPRPTLGQILLLAGLGFCGCWSFLQAGMAAPAVGDAMVYHLQRQVFWMQDQSVANYPTRCLRQLVMPPLAEFAGLHLMVLTGGDAAHNFLQWLALGLTAVGATLVTRRFRPSVTAQLLAALVVVTIPMAFIQASNTKNDDVVAMWVMIGLYLTLQVEESAWDWSRVVLPGLTFGALVLTKGTGFIFGVPLGVLFIWLLWRHHRSKAVGGLAMVAALVMAMNAGAFYRNWSSFGSPVPNAPAIHDGDTVINQDFSAAALLSNMARNVAPHFVLPNESWNQGLAQFVVGLHEHLGIGMNDPLTTFVHGRFVRYPFSQNMEDGAAAPAQMLCILALPILLALVWKQVPVRALLWIVAIAGADFVLFSWLLKWQVWNVRLIVAILVLFAPVFAWTWSAPRLRYIAPLFPMLLLVSLLPSLNLMQRPVFGPGNIFTVSRAATRFYETPEEVKTSFALADQIISLRPRRIAFYTGPATRDYRMQRLVLDKMPDPPRFFAFNPIFRVPGYHQGDYDIVLADPSLIAFSDGRPSDLRNDDTRSIYKRVAFYAPYVVYLREGSVGPKK